MSGNTGFALGDDAVALSFKDLTITDSTKATSATTVAQVKFRDNYQDHTGLINAKYKF